MSESKTQSILFTLLGLGRSGKILYATLIVLAGPALIAWTVWLPRVRFSGEDERLFKAARHGDRAAIESSLSAGGTVGATSPIDGKTALFRAAVFGHVDAVRLLLERGADPRVQGADGRSALEVVRAGRADEKDPARAHDLEIVADLLRDAEAKP